jgi:hypothetical protein
MASACAVAGAFALSAASPLRGGSIRKNREPSPLTILRKPQMKAMMSSFAPACSSPPAMPLLPRSIALTSGPVDGFAAFQRLVVNDAELFARLENTSTPDAFVAFAVEIGASCGLAFGADDVRAGLQAARRAWIERNVV